MLNEGAAGTRGYRRVIIGPDHPYFAGGLPMDAPGVGVGQNDGFVFQARAFLEEVAGLDEAESLPRNASFDEGVHNMEILAAVAESAANGGAAVTVAPQRTEVTDEVRGLQRDPARPVPTGGDRGDRELGLTGIELNSGGFLPPVHIPTFDDILTSDAARDDFLGQFEGTGVEIAD
jgi:hypothetical protein